LPPHTLPGTAGNKIFIQGSQGLIYKLESEPKSRIFNSPTERNMSDLAKKRKDASGPQGRVPKAPKMAAGAGQYPINNGYR